MRLVTDIRGALGLLTLIPVGRITQPVRPAAWFPWIGWLFGAVALGIAWAASLVVDADRGALLVGVMVISAWAFGSRLLHWDGLADTADALWGGHTVQRRLEIMHDSRTGAFGVTSVVLVALMQVAAIAMIVASRQWWALAAAPVIGRFSASIGLWSMRPARRDGLGASLAGRPGLLDVMLASSAVGLTLTVFCPRRIVIVCIVSILGLLVPRELGRRVGGVTGDILGASVLIVETVTLVAAALMGV